MLSFHHLWLPADERLGIILFPQEMLMRLHCFKTNTSNNKGSWKLNLATWWKFNLRAPLIDAPLHWSWEAKKEAHWEKNAEFPLTAIRYERNISAKPMLLGAMKEGQRPSPHHHCSILYWMPWLPPFKNKIYLATMKTSLAFYIIKWSDNTKVPWNSEELKNTTIVLWEK